MLLSLSPSQKEQMRKIKHTCATEKHLEWKARLQPASIL